MKKTTRTLSMTLGLAAALAGLAVVAAAQDRERPPPPRLPPIAFEACHGKQAGDACSIRFRDDTIEGVCATPPIEPERGLFCRLSRMPPPPEGMPPGPPPQ